MLDERKKWSQVWIDIVVLIRQKKIALTYILRPCASCRPGPSCSQKIDNPIQWIAQLIPKTYLLNSDLSVGWRSIQLLYNWRLYFIFIYCLNNLSAWHRLSVRLLQAAMTVIFSRLNKNVIGRSKRVQIKNVVLLLFPVYLKNKHIKQTFSIRLKRLTSAGASISCESCFTCACVRSHSITTYRINVTAVRVGRAFVDIYKQICCYNYNNLKASSLHT